ncbi:MAG TPA: toll/interleukin-1 receptor domain-containing protein [Thermoanaerobaculia bacterium]|nr:toll/interleukin-1 receptor domain-containing protein [Thermoanaerobaculia bacterium]
MAHDVFISYSSKDKPVADAVCAGLEAQGLRCWVAPRDILPGSDWGGAIIDAITGSKVMVLIFSGHANSSPQIKREVERAVAKGVKLVPFRIEDVALGKTLEYFISTPHWLDALTQPLEAHIGKLAETVRFLAAARDSSEVPPSLPKPTGARLAMAAGPAAAVAPPAPARSPSRAPLLVGLLAAAAAAAYFFVSRPEPPEIVAVNFPNAIPSNSQNVVGTVQFKSGRDAIARVEFSVVQAARFDGFSFAPNVAGQKRGSFNFGIHAAQPQQVTLAATLVDAAGRRSSPVSFSFEVQKAAARAPTTDRSIQINTPHGLKFKIPG